MKAIIIEDEEIIANVLLNKIKKVCKRCGCSHYITKFKNSPQMVG